MLAALAMTQTPVEPPPGELAEDHTALMARIVETRDRGAFRSLFVHYGPRLKSFMMKSGADHALADDLVQDVMMAVWRKVDLFAPERGTVSAWIFAIARNARIDRLRRQSSQPYEDLDDVEIASEGKDAEASTYSGQIAERVGEALAELPDEQRRIIELAYIQDMPQSEIAAKLRLPIGTVKSRMRLAYGKLKIELEELE
jgi:RNA polymerase sigma-70 factor, ECF subfamily